MFISHIPPPQLPVTSAVVSGAAPMLERDIRSRIIVLALEKVRFSAEHQGLLQDLVTLHSMGKVRMKAFLCNGAKLAASGANHWMSKVNFALDEGRGTMRSYIGLAPLTESVADERERLERERALRAEVTKMAGVEERALGAQLRWATHQGELQKERLRQDSARKWNSPQMAWVRLKQREDQVAHWASEVGRLIARQQRLQQVALWSLVEMAAERKGLATVNFSQREMMARDRYLQTLRALRVQPCAECNVAHYGDALKNVQHDGTVLMLCATCRAHRKKDRPSPCSWVAMAVCAVPEAILRTRSVELHFVRTVHAFMLIVRLAGGRLKVRLRRLRLRRLATCTRR